MALPKPPARRQRRNERGDAGILTARDDRPIPLPSKGWQKSTVDDWQGFWTSEVSSLVIESSDLSAVRRLFDYRDEYSRAIRSIRKERVTEGRNGQFKLSPMIDYVAKLERLISPLEDRFACSTLGRLRVGAELGNARRSLADINAALESEVVDDDNDADASIVELPGVPYPG